MNGAPRPEFALSPFRYYSVWAVGSGLWLTGALWLVFHYFLQRKTEFGIGPSPLEHRWLALHGAFAFAALWMIGLLWGVHIAKAWRSRRHRRSGGALLAVLVGLIASGYFLYYPPSEDSVRPIALLHWGVGLGLPAAFLVHRPGRARPARRRSGERDSGAIPPPSL